VIMFGALLALTVLSVWSIAPPDPRGPDAPPNEFSAARAFVYDERIATTPHVAGSSANDLVHEYLVSTLTGLGLRVETQDAIGKSPVKRSVAVAMAHVRNIVALLPGTDSTGRVILVAHYDSVQNGPGASDDGAGVSAILEVARALTASPDKPRNRIVFVLTDAGEPCLCAA